MNITHSKINIIKWWYDDTVFVAGFKDFIIKTDQIIDYYPLAGVSKKFKDAPVLLGIGWMVSIIHTDKTVISLDIEDDYIATIIDRSNEDEEILNMVNDSVQRLREVFNDKKEEIGIIDSLPDFSNHRREKLKELLIQHLDKQLAQHRH